MPRWRYDDDKGKDIATFPVRLSIDRAQYAILQAWRRDNPGWSFKQALVAAFVLGVQELGETYDPRRRIS